MEKLNGTSINEEYDLISLDVVSMFTNIPINLALESVSRRWDQIKGGTNIPRGEFINAVKIILDSTFFSFNNMIYKQKFGIPMGSPLSPIIADMVMENLEVRVLGNLNIQLPFYCRYVDDILLAAPRDKSKNVLDAFNSIHPKLQLTIEIGGKNLNFLDVMIINNNNILEFDVYQKPTFSGKVLSYLSKHPISQKRGVIINMVDRAFLLSHPKYHIKNLNFIIETFLGNDYPLNFVFETIYNRLKKLLNKKTKKQDIDNVTDEGLVPDPFHPETNGKI